MKAAIERLFRYPVKSMGGETLASVTLGSNGIPGDRAWVLRDETRQSLISGKRHPQLMACQARYAVPPAMDRTSSPAEITLPDGTVFTTDADGAAAVSALVDEALSLRPLMPADDLDYYRRQPSESDDPIGELREVFVRGPDEPLPDLSTFPPEIMEFQAPPGTYFDAFPLLLTTTTALSTMQHLASDHAWDVRRFRPNILISTDVSAGFPENDWAGREIAIGGARLKVEMACPRCIMATHGFDDLPKDPAIMRALLRENGGNLGVYATVTSPGSVAVGDVLEVL